MPLTLPSNAQILKEQTALQHQKAEDLIIPLLRNLENYSQYEAILKMYLQFYAPMQQSIREWIKPELLPDISERDHAGLLQKDLGEINSQEFISSIQFQNEGEALGALYVLEGSTLGGQVIARMLRKLSFIPDNKFNFFEGYGAATGERWKKFIEVLNNQPEVSSLLQGASSAFDLFINELKSCIINSNFSSAPNGCIMENEKNEANKEVVNPELQKQPDSPEEKKHTEVKNASASGLGAIQRPDGEKKKDETSY